LSDSRGGHGGRHPVRKIRRRRRAFVGGRDDAVARSARARISSRSSRPWSAPAAGQAGADEQARAEQRQARDHLVVAARG
jgi:hypothetical protein